MLKNKKKPKFIDHENVRFESNLSDISNEDVKKIQRAFSAMVLSRTLENKIVSLYRAGQILGGVYIGKGQEALSAAMAICLDRSRGDIFSPLIRDQAGRIAFGDDILDTVRTYLGTLNGPMRGRDGNIHHGRPKCGVPAMISHLGAMISFVSGILLSRRFKNQKSCVGVVSIGDGGSSTGSFHEAMNMVSVEKLPLVTVIANNQYAYSTPNKKQFACKNLVDRARAYGIRGHEIKYGNRIEDCYKMIKKAVNFARNGDGPQLVVASLLRLSGHGEHDNYSYLDGKKKNSKLGGDCLDIAKDFLIKNKLLGEKSIKCIYESANQKVEKAIRIARKDPKPDPYSEKWQPLSCVRLIDNNN